MNHHFDVLLDLLHPYLVIIGANIYLINEQKPITLLGGLLLVFLNTYRNNPQAHEITVVAFHPEVFRVSYFLRERMCKSLLTSSPKITRRMIARVASFSRVRDPKLR